MYLRLERAEGSQGRHGKIKLFALCRECATRSVKADFPGQEDKMNCFLSL